jgi:hypothetical protein
MKIHYLYGIALLILLGYIFYLKSCIPQPEPEVITETEYIQGRDSIIYEDRWYPLEIEKPVFIDKEDSTIKSSFDSTFVSGKDSISIKAEVRIKDSIAKWFMDIKHRDAETIRVDTLKITETKEKPETFMDKVKDVTFIVVLVEIVLAFFVFAMGGL